VTVPNTAMPYAPAAERNVLPNPAKIAAAAAALAGK
jgi:pyruvate/2-oxoglutarate/acetoin dehydrogenase E1 component